jgi:signal transduction histidine kinase
MDKSNQYNLELSDLLFKPFRAAEEPMAATNIALILTSALNNVMIPEDVSVITEIDSATLPSVKANHFFVEVFLEIISNAVEAMQDVAIKKLVISASSDDSSVSVSFLDSGIGISDEDQEKIFDLFTSRDRKKESSHFGFGLWWVRMFMRDIGGDINVVSRHGEGAMFTLKFTRGMMKK